MTSYHNTDLGNLNFLITGGAGFIGSHVTEYLLKNGAGKVRVLDNFLTGSENNIGLFSNYPNFEFVQGDIRDREVCKKACKGIDHVNHQAALGSVPRSILDPVTSNEVNVSGFVNMITAAKDAGVKTFVYASSSSVYGDEPGLPKVETKTGNQLSPYAVTKMADELYAGVFFRQFSMKVIGLRYFNVFGPRQDPSGPYAAVIPVFVDRIMKGESVRINGDGEQTRDFTYVDNAVQANIRAMFATNDAAYGEAYNIAVGEQFSVNHLYNSIRELLGIDHQPTHVEARAGDIRNSLADISKAEKLLGYKPTFNFPEGLKKTVEYFQLKH